MGEMSAVEGAKQLRVIDADVHAEPASAAAINAYLPSRWRRYRETFGDRVYLGAGYPRIHGYRVDAYPDGGQPGSDLDLLRAQLLDHWNVEAGIININIGAPEELNSGLVVALTEALNEWVTVEWLDREPRLRASILVPYEEPGLAAAQVSRFAGDSRFVQVLLSAVAREPLGRRKYWPIYEAAVTHDLPVGFHFGGWGGFPPSGTGSPSFYFEYHAGATTSFQDLVISLVSEGVLEEFPTLKIVLIEGGFAWLAPLMWRLDRAWHLLGSEMPHLSKLPSEYIRNQIWFTTQPIEEPARPEQLQALFDHLDMDEHVMFATDYPHWDFDAPDLALPRKLRPDLRQRVLRDNARALYRLDPVTTRPVSSNG